MRRMKTTTKTAAVALFSLFSTAASAQQPGASRRRGAGCRHARRPPPRHRPLRRPPRPPAPPATAAPPAELPPPPVAEPPAPPPPTARRARRRGRTEARRPERVARRRRTSTLSPTVQAEVQRLHPGPLRLAATTRSPASTPRAASPTSTASRSGAAGSRRCTRARTPSTCCRSTRPATASSLKDARSDVRRHVDAARPPLHHGPVQGSRSATRSSSRRPIARCPSARASSGRCSRASAIAALRLTGRYEWFHFMAALVNGNFTQGDPVFNTFDKNRYLDTYLRVGGRLRLPRRSPVGAVRREAGDDGADRRADDHGHEHGRHHPGRRDHACGHERDDAAIRHLAVRRRRAVLCRRPRRRRPGAQGRDGPVAGHQQGFPRRRRPTRAAT